MDKALIPGTGGKTGGSSDPVVTLRVMPGGHTATSKTKMKNLTPVWRERFELAAPDVLAGGWHGDAAGQGGQGGEASKATVAASGAASGAAAPAGETGGGGGGGGVGGGGADGRAMLEVVVDDYDHASGNDFMGKLLIPLADLKVGRCHTYSHSCQFG